jgi:hypothetical protein
MRSFILVLSLTLGGCVIVSVPVDETLNLLSSGTTELMSLSSRNSTPCKLRHQIKLLCIENNQNVVQPDLVPAIQQRLRELGLESPLYDPGTMPSRCDAVLRYNATRGWAQHFSSDQAQSYLQSADMTLFMNHAVVATAQFQTSRMAFDKWSSSEAKLSSVVDDLMCKKVNAR